MQLAPWTHPEASPVQPLVARPAARAPRGGASLQQLERVSARLRDPATRGEVLTLVLEFAAELFSRVAIFMLRDDVIVGMAQPGLARAGGPGDDELRGLCMPANELGVAARRDRDRRSRAGRALERRRSPPGRAARLAASRSRRTSRRSTAAAASRPCSTRTTCPSPSPLADTTALAIVLHEAGLALDRALLERALAQAD